MERIVNAFGKLFSLRRSAVVVNQVDRMTTVETEAQSTFSQLDIESQGDTFYVVRNAFYKNLFNGKSTAMGNVNCDGIALVEHEEQPYVLLVELKSNVDADKISEAFQQEVRSFLKLNTALGICDGYCVTDFAIRGVIACHPFKSEDERTHCLHNLLWEKDAGKKDARFKYRMITEKKITARFENCKWFIPADALHNDIRNHEFTISLVFGANYSDPSLSIPLSAVI